jgi:hypothetical protein
MYAISDDELEFPVHDRISFMEFLGLGIEDHIPDAKTVWLFRAHLAQHDLVKEVFAHLDNYLRAQVLNLATKLYISRQGTARCWTQLNSRRMTICIYSLLCYYGMQTIKMRGQRDAYTFLRFTAKNCSCIPSGRTIREVAKRFIAKRGEAIGN